MVEGRRSPGRGVVALRAVRRCKRRSGARVHRVGRLLPGSQVATGISAIRGSNLQIDVVIDVAARTGHVGMAGRQGESGRSVIEGGSQPAIKFVAALAVAGGKRRSRARMRRVRGLLPIFQVAGIATRRESEEYSRSRLLVAFLAVNRGMGAEKREAILVILHLLVYGCPALHRVALSAIRAHLAAVNIRVTIDAVLPHIGEDRIQVTESAFHTLVHSAQRISRLVVVEFRVRLDRAPRGSGVTILTRDSEFGAMRASSGRFIFSLGR